MQLEAALEQRRAGLPDGNPAIADSEYELGRILRRSQHLDRAEELLRSALATRQAVLGRNHAAAAEVLGELGALATQRGDHDAAGSLLREALAIRRRTLPPDDVAIALNLHNLGLHLQRTADLEGAAQHYREALSIYRRTLGDAHAWMIPTVHNLANTIRKQGSFAAAERLLREGLRQVQTVYGDSHPNTARSLTNLGQLLSTRGRNEEAFAMLNEALEIRIALFGEAHRDTAMSKLSLGFASLRAGHLDQAEPYLRQAETVFRDVERPSFAASAVSGRASVAGERGDFETAEALAREALGLTDADFGANNPERPAYEILLAEILRDRGRSQEAHELFADAIPAIQVGNYRGESWDLASARAGRGSTLLLMGEVEAAEADLRSAYAEISEIEAPPHVKADICGWLGAALTALGRYREAEPLLIEDYEVSSQRSSDLQSTIVARERLAALYESWGRPEQAARYR